MAKPNARSVNMKPHGSLTSSPHTACLGTDSYRTGGSSSLSNPMETTERKIWKTVQRAQEGRRSAIVRASGRCCSGFGLRPRPTSSPVFPKELTLLGWKCSWLGDFENPDCQLGRHAPLRRSNAYFSGFLWKPSPAPALRHSPPCELLQEADVLTSAFGQRLTLDKCKQEGRKVLTRMIRWQDSI